MNAKELLNDIANRLDDYFQGYDNTALYTSNDICVGVGEFFRDIDLANYDIDGESGFDKRAAALKLAREHVEKAKTGQYERNTGRKDQITEELRVAQYLLGGEA